MNRNKKTEKKTSKKKVAVSIAAAAVAAAIIIPGTIAYLTDNETAVNTFTIGRTSIETEEPHWDLTDANSDGIPDASENTVPNQEIAKDPLVKNTGNNDAIVFMRVTVPVKDVTLIANDGTKAAGNHKPQEIFYLKTAATGEETHNNVFNTKDWVELPTKEVNNGTTQTVGQRTYVFAYKKRLPKSFSPSQVSQTSTLFDKVQAKNIIENEVSSDQMNNIKVETWAIQADNIEGDGSAASLPNGKTVDTASLDSTKLNYIYDVFVHQNGLLLSDGTMKYTTWQDGEHGAVEKESSTSGTTDINGNIVHSKLRATVETSYLVPQSVTDEALAQGYKAGYEYGGYPSHTQMTVTFLERSSKLKTDAVKFSSSNNNVATVDENTGEIKAVGFGTATITAKAEDNSYVSISIHVVKDARPASGTVEANNSDNRPQ